MKKNIIIHTDGAAKGNPGKAGWGAVIIVNNKDVFEICNGVDIATNNQMELKAMIEAFDFVYKKIKPKDFEIEIFSDSKYVLDGLNSWIHGWKKNNWQTKSKQDVLNRSYWEMLDVVKDNLSRDNRLIFKKVAGHSGVTLNEICDKIASDFGKGEKVLLFSGSFKEYLNRIGEINNIPENKEKKSLSKKSSSKIPYSYVSFIDGEIFTDKTWDMCEKRVKGKSGAKFQKVFSKQEEKELIALWTLKSLF